MNKIITYFKDLSIDDIHNIRPGIWDDDELLAVVQYFDENGEDDHAIAIYELILRSPEHSELIDYPVVYFDLVELLMRQDAFMEALRWQYVAIAYAVQHKYDVDQLYRDLAVIYLQSGEIDKGISLLTHCLQIEPHNVWVHNSLGLIGTEVDLPYLTAEVMTRALSLIEKRGEPKSLQNQLTEFLEEAQKLLEDDPEPDNISPAILADFRHALYLDTPPIADGWHAYPPLIDELIKASDDGEACFTTIASQGYLFAADLIRLAFDTNLIERDGPRKAITLLKHLQHEGMHELDYLVDWLSQATDNWHDSLLQNFGKVGFVPTPQLFDISQDTAYGVYIRVATVGAIGEQAHADEEWQAYVQLLRTLLTRPEAYEAKEETFIGFIIADIEEQDVKELYPEIKQAFDEDRVDMTIIDLNSVHDAWKMPAIPQPKRRQDGFYLYLQCKACHRVREHFTQIVFHELTTQNRQIEDKKTEYDPFILDHEVICPKCGSKDQYTVTNQSSMRLLFASNSPDIILDSLLDNNLKKKPKVHPRIFAMQGQALGKLMHPLAALKQYRALVAQNPNSAFYYNKMGNVFAMLTRHDEAIAAYQKAYELDSTNPEIVMNYAMQLHDSGEKSEAKRLYERTIQLIGPDFTEDGDLYDILHGAREGLKRLKMGKNSPYDIGLRNTYGQSIAQVLTGIPPRSKSKSLRKKQPKKKKKRRR